MNTLAAGGIELPLNDNQAKRVQDALSGLSATQLQWVSGYVAGMAAANASVPRAAAKPGETLTILYGSQTGNGETIAASLARTAEDRGFASRLTSLADFKPANLKRETLVAFVISTHGEGDPPDDAELFHEFILSAKAPRLPKLRFSVLALGDSSYANFCQIGREFDRRLADLGAERLDDLIECDVDYEGDARLWSDRLLGRLPDLIEARENVPHLRAVRPAAAYDKHRPFSAEVLVNQKITGSGSTKDVRHIELSLEGSGLSYEPGDALAVVADNPPQLVEQLLETLNLCADAAVSIEERNMPLADALIHDLEITRPSLGFIKAWARYSDAAGLERLLADGQQQALSEFINTYQIIDVVRKYRAGVSAADFVECLRKLSPRSYSIASSQRANPGEAHLTVAAVRYATFGNEHWGAASTHIVDRVGEGDTLSVYVEPNPRFRLPADDAPIIMIGPGTGVAPYRAFVEERAERGANGRNWLFFGDRNFSSDFLYQLEWQRQLKQGHLQRLDVAFSRDQQDKHYVQHRLIDRGADVYSWLQDGAVIYVCGDAKHMAGDVHDALREVLVTHGGLSAEQAASELKQMRRAGRYRRDVY